MTGDTSPAPQSVSDALIEPALRAADEISERIYGDGHQPTTSDVERLRDHIRQLATALQSTESAREKDQARIAELIRERDEALKDRDGWKQEAIIRGREINRLEGGRK